MKFVLAIFIISAHRNVGERVEKFLFCFMILNVLWCQRAIQTFSLPKKAGTYLNFTVFLGGFVLLAFFLGKNGKLPKCHRLSLSFVSRSRGARFMYLFGTGKVIIATHKKGKH